MTTDLRASEQRRKERRRAVDHYTDQARIALLEAALTSIEHCVDGVLPDKRTATEWSVLRAARAVLSRTSEEKVTA